MACIKVSPVTQLNVNVLCGIKDAVEPFFFSPKEFSSK